MDQSCIAGVGNIYRAEILFKAGVHPEQPARTIPRPGFEKLWTHSVLLLQRGFLTGRYVRWLCVIVMGNPGGGGGQGGMGIWGCLLLWHGCGHAALPSLHHHTQLRTQHFDGGSRGGQGLGPALVPPLHLQPEHLRPLPRTRPQLCVPCSCGESERGV